MNYTGNCILLVICDPAIQTKNIHNVSFHMTTYLSSSTFIVILNCEKKILWFWEKSPQSCQFGIISVRGTPQKKLILTTLWTLDWYIYIYIYIYIYWTMLNISFVEKSANDSCNGFLHCFASPENFTSVTLQPSVIQGYFVGFFNSVKWLLVCAF